MITVAQALDAMAQAVERKGEDYVYTDQETGGGHGMKTPEQIASEIADEYGATGLTVEESLWMTLIINAIEADRAQRLGFDVEAMRQAFARIESPTIFERQAFDILVQIAGEA